MKHLFRLFFTLLLLLAFCLPLSARETLDAKGVSEAIQKSVPTEFGYVDNSEYYMSSYFSALKGVDDFHIVTCADSTNFSEIGVFHMKDAAHLAHNQKLLKKYLLQIKSNFENGVVYNTKEYPKFENAKVFAKGEYLVYVVLNKEDALRAEKALEGAAR